MLHSPDMDNIRFALRVSTRPQFYTVGERIAAVHALKKAVEGITCICRKQDFMQRIGILEASK